MVEGCSHLRFFQSCLMSDRTGFSFSVQEEFHTRFEKDLLFPEQENKTISVQNTTLKVHLSQLNF